MRTITNLRFTDGVDGLADEKEKLQTLVENFDKTCTRCKMEIKAEKYKLMTNRAHCIQREIKVIGHMLGAVSSF